jgi:hypothetical protein
MFLQERFREDKAAIIIECGQYSDEDIEEVMGAVGSDLKLCSPGDVRKD